MATINRLKSYAFAKKKGDTARIRAGIVAQEVQAAFAAQGLNAADYGLFCYEEALALEAAYQRWELEKIKQRLTLAGV